MHKNPNPVKYGLALHTSSPELGLAISNFAGDSRCQTWDLGRDLSTQLHQYLAEFIEPQAWRELEFVAVAKGPGSFTGTRIGVVTARTLAQQLNIPLFAISTLAIMAWEKRKKSETSPNQVLAVQMPAQRGQVFAGIYKVSASELDVVFPDTAIVPAVWQQTLDALKMPYQLIQVEGGLGASVNSLLELAYLDWQEGLRPHWAEALPFYGQHPVDG